MGLGLGLVTSHSWGYGFWVRVGDIPFSGLGFGGRVGDVPFFRFGLGLVTLVSHFGVLGLATFEGYDIILAANF